jgi:hypothetical protein
LFPNAAKQQRAKANWPHPIVAEIVPFTNFYEAEKLPPGLFGSGIGDYVPLREGAS